VPGLTVSVDQGDGDHTAKLFTTPSLIIGRDPGSDISLKDDTVSARHAQLTYHHNQWWIVDLSSTNGTILNGLPVVMPTVITTGDEIKCGNATLRVGLETDVFISKTEKVQTQD
jgi:pSer/pThr/pTyr-binding forkhead associated (FHA) protein